MPPLIDRASVERLYHRADAARWQLSLDDFARALRSSVAKAFAGRTPSARDVERYFESLRHEDLALACACAAGHEAAWDHFVLEYRPVLYRAADALDPSGGARELADSLYADLFGLDNEPCRRPANGDRCSAISTAGAASRRGCARCSPNGWSIACAPAPEPPRFRTRNRRRPTHQVPDPDRDRYLALIHKALGEAVANLDARARLRIRYYYVQGLTLAETGRLLGEHEASVSRHLSAARKAIRRDVERRLSESGLAREEITQCFASWPRMPDRSTSTGCSVPRRVQEIPPTDVQSEEASAFAPTIGIGRKRQ